VTARVPRQVADRLWLQIAGGETGLVRAIDAGERLPAVAPDDEAGVVSLTDQGGGKRRAAKLKALPVDDACDLRPRPPRR
jgi:hypothetical protein